MATTNKTTKTAKTAPAKTAPAPAPAPAMDTPMAPRYVLGPWPHVQANSIRAYCKDVAAKLTAAMPEGFTVAEYATALAANAKGTTYKQPRTGWGTAEKPNSTARQHANWFASPMQGWLAPAPAPAK